MRNTIIALLTLASIAPAATLYDNTTTDTFGTVLFSVGIYDSIGDQIQLSTAGNASLARVQMYNLGGAGRFDAILRFFAVGAPIGAQIGASFALTGIGTSGGDILDLLFPLGNLALPSDVIFMVSIANAGAGVDLGLNLFEPPTVGTSDGGFLLVDFGGFGPLATSGENVYFQLTDSAVPEPSTLSLLGLGALAITCRWRGIWRRQRENSDR